MFIWFIKKWFFSPSGSTLAHIKDVQRKVATWYFQCSCLVIHQLWQLLQQEVCIDTAACGLRCLHGVRNWLQDNSYLRKAEESEVLKKLDLLCRSCNGAISSYYCNICAIQYEQLEPMTFLCFFLTGDGKNKSRRDDEVCLWWCSLLHLLAKGTIGNYNSNPFLNCNILPGCLQNKEWVNNFIISFNISVCIVLDFFCLFSSNPLARCLHGILKLKKKISVFDDMKEIASCDGTEILNDNVIFQLCNKASLMLSQSMAFRNYSTTCQSLNEVILCFLSYCLHLPDWRFLPLALASTSMRLDIDDQDRIVAETKSSWSWSWNWDEAKYIEHCAVLFSSWHFNTKEIVARGRRWK